MLACRSRCIQVQASQDNYSKPAPGPAARPCRAAVLASAAQTYPWGTLSAIRGVCRKSGHACERSSVVFRSGAWRDSEHGVVWEASMIQAATGGDLLRQGHSGPILTDTRHLTTPGAWFLALQGQNYDGHDFLNEARSKGCSGAIVSQPPGPGWDRGLVVVEDTATALQDLAKDVRRRFVCGTVVAITGSCGKTTAKDMVVAMASRRHHVHATEGNMNNAIGLPLTLLKTPSATDLIVLELGMSAPGEIAQLAGICQPHVRLITSVAAAHVEGVGSSLEDVASAKAELLQGAEEGDTAIINADDPHVAAMVVPNGVRTISFGRSASADVRVCSESQAGPSGALGSSFDLLPRSGDSTGAAVAMPCIGKHLPVTAAAAAAVGMAIGIGLQDAAAGLSGFPGVNMRMQLMPSHGSGLTIINDAYNANPASVSSALELLGELPVPDNAQRVAILGDMLELGAMEAGAHRDAIELCREIGIDVVGLAGPLFNSAMIDVAESLQQSGGEMKLLSAGTAEELGRLVSREIGRGDIVLVKGSRRMGMEATIPLILAGADSQT